MTYIPQPCCDCQHAHTGAEETQYELLTIHTIGEAKASSAGQQQNPEDLCCRNTQVISLGLFFAPSEEAAMLEGERRINEWIGVKHSSWNTTVLLENLTVSSL